MSQRRRLTIVLTLNLAMIVALVIAPWREGCHGRDLQRSGPHARRGRSQLLRDRLRPKWPKGVAKITDELGRLLAFYDYPAEHWIHLRTTNPDRVHLRHRPAAATHHQGPRLQGRRVAMAFKLMESAQARWRAINAPHQVALVRAGATFTNGKLLERPNESGGDQQVA